MRKFLTAGLPLRTFIFSGSQIHQVKQQQLWQHLKMSNLKGKLPHKKMQNKYKLL
jgi:hypothetical protein